MTPLVQRDAPLLNVQSQFKVFFFLFDLGI